jgi:hypothetical protein
MPDKIRKGDIVAIETTETTTFAFGSGRAPTTRKRWRLATVTAASRDGKAKAVQVGIGCAQKLEHMSGKPTVYSILGFPDRAKRLLAADKSAEWDAKDALQAAILAA